MIVSMPYGVTDINKVSRFLSPANQIFVGSSPFYLSDIGDNRTARLDYPFSRQFVRSHQ